MGLLDAILDKLQPAKTKDENKKLYFDALVEALEDGILTNDEMSELDGLRKKLRLHESDVAGMKLRAFQVAANAAAADGVVTPKEERDLQKIKSYLGIEDNEIGRTRGTLNKMRMLYEIHKGNLPMLEIPGLGLNHGESAHVSENAGMYEDESGTAVRPNSTIQIKPGQPYRMGAGRAQPLPIEALQHAASGTFTITNNRLLFNTGIQGKTFGATYGRIAGILVFTDGFGIVPDNAPARYFRVDNKQELELMAGILSRFLNPPAEKPGEAPAGPKRIAPPPKKRPT